MKWHIAHRHEIPAAFDTLGQSYEGKTAILQDDNIRLKQESAEIEKRLGETAAELIREREARLQAEVTIRQLAESRFRAIAAVAILHHFLEEKFGIRLENPFETPNGS